MSYAYPSSSGGGGGGGPSRPCGACKFLRRRCDEGCIYAPYFISEQGAVYFAAVHKVFGASNFSKLLHHIPLHKRHDAAATVCYEAQARLRDPVYGCVSNIFSLQQKVSNLQAEVTYLQAHMAALGLPPPPPLQPAQPLMAPPQLSLADLLSAPTVPTTYDLSSLFEPIWTMQQPQNQLNLMDPRHFRSILRGSGRGSSTGVDSSSSSSMS